MHRGSNSNACFPPIRAQKCDQFGEEHDLPDSAEILTRLKDLHIHAILIAELVQEVDSAKTSAHDQDISLEVVRIVGASPVRLAHAKIPAKRHS